MEQSEIEAEPSDNTDVVAGRNTAGPEEDGAVDPGTTKNVTMIKDFPHYSTAAMRAALKIVRGRYEYTGEALWWHFLEYLNQHDAQPIDLSNEDECYLACEYIHPLERDPEKRKEFVFEFFDFCARYKGRDGVALIDPDLWAEKKAWNEKNAANQQRVLKRRKVRDEVPQEVVDFAHKMHEDIKKIARYAKFTPKWPQDVYDLVKKGKPSLDEAKQVWAWLQTSTDRNAIFWRTNVIKSPAKFRDRFADVESLYSRPAQTTTRKTIFER